MNRRSLTSSLLLVSIALAIAGAGREGGLLGSAVHGANTRPHILFAIADDWGWPHAGVYGDPVVQTPTFDRVACEGVLFRQAYVSSPSCTASRGAILTGQYHWRLEGVANLASVFPDKFATFPELLEQSGYEIGFRNKGWGPGVTEIPRFSAATR